MHWRRKWQPTPVFLPGESQGWGSLVGCCLWGHTESDMTGVTQKQQQQGDHKVPNSAAFSALTVLCNHRFLLGFPGDSAVKNPPASAGDMGSIPDPGRSPGQGNGKPLQYSCLGNATDSGARRDYGPWSHRVGYDLAAKQHHLFLVPQHFCCPEKKPPNP